MSQLDYTFTGSFTSTGVDKTLYFRSNIDYIKVMNYTQMASASSTDRGVMFEWWRGMADGYGMEYKVTDNSANILNGTIVTSGGFTEVDTTDQTISSSVAFTAISTATPPVVSTADTSLLTAGDVVRIYSATTGKQLNGLDFTIGSVVSNTSFTLPYMATIAAGGSGTWRKVYYDPIFYPRNRYISAITQASSAVVTMTVAHAYSVGDVVSFRVPSAFGMVEMDGLYGEVTAVATSTITVNIDSSAFTAFAFPVSADAPFTPAQVIAVGADAPQNDGQDIATENQAVMGIKLGNGVNGPAGVTSDVIYYIAHKSFDNDNA